MPESPKPPAIIVRDKATKSEVDRVPVSNPTESKVARVMRGMMINLDDYAQVVKLAQLTLHGLTTEIVKRN